MNEMPDIEYTALVKRKGEIVAALASLRRGYISRKTINGKKYRYLQIRANGKMVSIYLKSDEADRVAAELAERKTMEAELPKIVARMTELEQAAKLIGRGADRRLMLLNISMGMDAMDAEQKKRSISFADAMNAIEGVPVSEQTAKDIADWQNGKKTYLAVFETVLKRYGFPTEE